MKYTIAIALLLLMWRCTPGVNQTPKADIKFVGNYMVCDTCQTTLLVHHTECTTCADISVDSGTVYFPWQIYKQAKSLVNPVDIVTYLFPPNTINVNQLYLADTNYFTKLWPNINNYTDSFMITGNVVNVKRRVLSNGVVEVYPSLYFTIKTFSAYTKIKKPSL